MDFDEKILVLRALKELHPFLEKEFEKSIQCLKDEAAEEATKGMPYTWVSFDEKEAIRGKLELMADEELRAYTLEELASLLKEK